MTAPSAADMGGRTDVGPVPRAEEVHEPWHESVMRLLMSSGRFGLSRISGEARYLLEVLDPELYRSLGYYERWALAVAELYSRLPEDATVPPGPAARYPGARAVATEGLSPPLAVGTRVVVRAEPPPGHHRMPAYTWGRRGVVRAVHAPQEVPGCHVDAVRHEHVYSVAFTFEELWGHGTDELRIDLWASYVSPVEEDA